MPVPVFAATNNVVVAGDLGRRVVPIDLDARCERPEERSGFKHPEVLKWVHANRPRLVAALTVLRHFHVAGRPQANVTAFGSYEAWSTLVRQALLALGEADPCAGRDRIRAEGDPALEALRVALREWRRAFGAHARTGREALDKCGHDKDLRDALAALADVDPTKLEGRRLGYALRRIRGRIVDELRFERSSESSNGFRWRVVSNSDLHGSPDVSTGMSTQQLLIPEEPTAHSGDRGHESIDLTHKNTNTCNDAMINDARIYKEYGAGSPRSPVREPSDGDFEASVVDMHQKIENDPHLHRSPRTTSSSSGMACCDRARASPFAS